MEGSMACPKCGGKMVADGTRMICPNENCDFLGWVTPVKLDISTLVQEIISLKERVKKLEAEIERNR